MMMMMINNNNNNNNNKLSSLLLLLFLNATKECFTRQREREREREREFVILKYLSSVHLEEEEKKDLEIRGWRKYKQE